MSTIGKAIIGVLLALFISGTGLGCLNVNKPPDEKPKTEVNVGGQHGVTVTHDKEPPPSNP